MHHLTDDADLDYLTEVGSAPRHMALALGDLDHHIKLNQRWISKLTDTASDDALRLASLQHTNKTLEAAAESISTVLAQWFATHPLAAWAEGRDALVVARLLAYLDPYKIIRLDGLIKLCGYKLPVGLTDPCHPGYQTVRQLARSEHTCSPRCSDEHDDYSCRIEIHAVGHRIIASLWEAMRANTNTAS